MFLCKENPEPAISLGCLNCSSTLFYANHFCLASAPEYETYRPLVHYCFLGIFLLHLIVIVGFIFVTSATRMLKGPLASDVY